MAENDEVVHRLRLAALHVYVADDKARTEALWGRG